MPIPSRKPNEATEKFLSRCMSNPTMNKEYPDSSQRYAICMGQTKGSLIEQVCANIAESNIGFTEELTPYNFIIPEDDMYEDFGEEVLELDFNAIATFIYRNPSTSELFYYSTKGTYLKDGSVLEFVSEAAEYQGRKVQLNKPFRTPDGPKKFSVYVQNDRGNVVKVNFGDPNSSIKKDNPERRKSFRARHKCDTAKDKTTPRYWSCKMW